MTRTVETVKVPIDAINSLYFDVYSDDSYEDIIRKAEMERKRRHLETHTDHQNGESKKRLKIIALTCRPTANHREQLAQRNTVIIEKRRTNSGAGSSTFWLHYYCDQDKCHKALQLQDRHEAELRRIFIGEFSLNVKQATSITLRNISEDSENGIEGNCALDRAYQIVEAVCREILTTDDSATQPPSFQALTNAVEKIKKLHEFLRYRKADILQRVKKLAKSIYRESSDVSQVLKKLKKIQCKEECYLVLTHSMRIKVGYIQHHYRTGNIISRKSIFGLCGDNETDKKIKAFKAKESSAFQHGRAKIEEENLSLLSIFDEKINPNDSDKVLLMLRDLFNCFDSKNEIKHALLNTAPWGGDEGRLLNKIYVWYCEGKVTPAFFLNFFDFLPKKAITSFLLYECNEQHFFSIFLERRPAIAMQMLNKLDDANERYKVLGTVRDSQHNNALQILIKNNDDIVFEETIEAFREVISILQNVPDQILMIMLQECLQDIFNYVAKRFPEAKERKEEYRELFKKAEQQEKKEKEQRHRSNTLEREKQRDQNKKTFRPAGKRRQSSYSKVGSHDAKSSVELKQAAQELRDSFYGDYHRVDTKRQRYIKAIPVSIFQQAIRQNKKMLFDFALTTENFEVMLSLLDVLQISDLVDEITQFLSAAVLAKNEQCFFDLIMRISALDAVGQISTKRHDANTVCNYLSEITLVSGETYCIDGGPNAEVFNKIFLTVLPLIYQELTADVQDEFVTRIPGQYLIASLVNARSAQGYSVLENAMHDPDAKQFLGILSLVRSKAPGKGEAICAYLIKSIEDRYIKIIEDGSNAEVVQNARRSLFKLHYFCSLNIGVERNGIVAKWFESEIQLEKIEGDDQRNAAYDDMQKQKHAELDKNTHDELEALLTCKETLLALSDDQRWQAIGLAKNTKGQTMLAHALELNQDQLFIDILALLNEQDRFKAIKSSQDLNGQTILQGVLIDQDIDKVITILNLLPQDKWRDVAKDYGKGLLSLAFHKGNIDFYWQIYKCLPQQDRLRLSQAVKKEKKNIWQHALINGNFSLFFQLANELPDDDKVKLVSQPPSYKKQNQRSQLMLTAAASRQEAVEDSSIFQSALLYYKNSSQKDEDLREIMHRRGRAAFMGALLILPANTRMITLNSYDDKFVERNVRSSMVSIGDFFSIFDEDDHEAIASRMLPVIRDLEDESQRNHSFDSIPLNARISAICSQDSFGRENFYQLTKKLKCRFIRELLAMAKQRSSENDAEQEKWYNILNTEVTIKPGTFFKKISLTLADYIGTKMLKGKPNTRALDKAFMLLLSHYSKDINEFTRVSVMRRSIGCSLPNTALFYQQLQLQGVFPSDDSHSPEQVEPVADSHENNHGEEHKLSRNSLFRDNDSQKGASHHSQAWVPPSPGEFGDID